MAKYEIKNHSASKDWGTRKILNILSFTLKFSVTVAMNISSELLPMLAFQTYYWIKTDFFFRSVSVPFIPKYATYSNKDLRVESVSVYTCTHVHVYEHVCVWVCACMFVCVCLYNQEVTQKDTQTICIQWEKLKARIKRNKLNKIRQWETPNSTLGRL